MTDGQTGPTERDAQTHSVTVPGLAAGGRPNWMPVIKFSGFCFFAPSATYRTRHSRISTVHRQLDNCCSVESQRLNRNGRTYIVSVKQ